MILQSLPWDLLIVWVTPQRQCLLRSWTLQKKGNLLLGLFPSKVCTLFFQLLWDIYTLQKKKSRPNFRLCFRLWFMLHTLCSRVWLCMLGTCLYRSSLATCKTQWLFLTEKWTCSVSRKCSSANNFHATFVVLKGPALAASCRQYFGGVHCRPGIHFVRNTPQSMDSLHHFICQSASRKSCDPLEMV